VQFEEVQIPAEFIGRNYEQDGEYRLAFQGWINQLWETERMRCWTDFTKTFQTNDEQNVGGGLPPIAVDQ